MTLRKFIVEREIPGAGELSPDDLRGVARTSNGAITELAAPYHWIQSFVTAHKIYCIHVAPDEATVREHARRGGFPCDRIEEVKATIDPSAEGLPREVAEAA